jgi:kynureninase
MLARLVARGIMADYRAPDIIRVAPVPLFNTYYDAWRLAEVLRETIVPG